MSMISSRAVCAALSLTSTGVAKAVRMAAARAMRGLSAIVMMLWNVAQKQMRGKRYCRR
jgi:hypothetical protein